MVYSVYNYYAADQMKQLQNASSNTAHKRSELRKIYNAIISMSKKTPLYMLQPTENVQSFAISLKEASMKLTDCLNSMDSDQEASFFHEKQACSEYPDKADVFFIPQDSSSPTEAVTLAIQALAEPQKNLSQRVPSLYPSPVPGSYHFIVDIDENTYSFQFNVSQESTNEENFKKLSEFINQSPLGLNASVLHPKAEEVQLRLESVLTGSVDGIPIFHLTDTGSPENGIGLIQYYGLDQISRPASNAHFSVNGVQKASLSNELSLNNALRIHLLSPSDKPFQIFFEPAQDPIYENLSSFCSQYNDIIALANRSAADQKSPKKVAYNYSDVLHSYKNELESAGIMFHEDGIMELDRALAFESIKSGEMSSLFSESKGLLPRLKDLATYMTLNPMDYVDKTILTYPDYSKPGVACAYITSIYSGMLFNYYC